MDNNLLKAIKSLGFTELTPIQEKCIPSIRKGIDVVGQSSTGSGKTAAFGLPILEKVVAGKGLQFLVLTPTRELCVQVAAALRDFSVHLRLRILAVYGGVAIQPQIDMLRSADIVVATPGRMCDHLERRTADLSKVRFVVLDEADKMFEMGFVDDVERIVRSVHSSHQTLLFSATVPQAVMGLINKHLRNPFFVKVDSYVDKQFLKNIYYNVSYHDKFSLLFHLLKKHSGGRSLVFCGKRSEVDVVAKNLKLNGIFAAPIHGGLSQNRRDASMDLLKSDKVNVLVATDVAARGLDIKNITHVYNYDVPKTPGEYVHRVGRTARAGKTGEAITLLCDRDYENFDHVVRDRSLDIQKSTTPSFEKMKFVRTERFERSSSGRFGDRQGQRPSGRFGDRPRPSGRFGDRQEQRPSGRFSDRKGSSSSGQRFGKPKRFERPYKAPRFGGMGRNS
ncbi:MAG: DEAD/DEAH box helicase [Candidatus Woesearchaeota archaeon]